MDFQKCTSFRDAPLLGMAPLNIPNKVHEKGQFEKITRATGHAVETDVDIDLREVYFLIMHFLSSGPCQRTFGQFWNELLEHQLLPRRYHAWYSRSGAHSGDDNDNGISFPLSYNNLVNRYPHIEKDHLLKLLKQLILSTAASLHGNVGGNVPNAADGPTLLGTGSFSLLASGRNKENKQVKPQPAYLRWPHMQADQVRGLSLREIGGGFTKHHRAPSIRSACYAIAKPSTMVQKMQNIKKLRGHRDAVYCAIFDRLGRYVITGSDDRLVKIWSMETAFCLASCRGHEGDITDLAVSSNNALVASASNDLIIRVWRLPDGLPISALRGHTGAVTAIAFSPRPTSVYQLLSSSDDGTCRIWDARYSQCSPRIYLPKPSDASCCNGSLSSNGPPSHQILCCAYNANGTVFVTGSSDTFARVWSACKFNTDDSEQPVHEMDVLSGHENDVNYVQFSGCAVASRSSMSDTSKEDNIPKFKNSWFCHDNIVTCSRDGSAIIWIPRPRRSHGKVGRWTRAYHLKVPPPPMPPQPPRGGPRQRFLPTPRGVNMIVWSLDNRFVLAAIMDCRICVWNAADGSLVHSLTGHNASTYVLDVHPFNPRIAMSAGYDGKTIVWDIWEGTPIRVYEIGRFKLVDGKFSPDGTSIVLSDDVGQIYLLSTGQGEYQKDAKYDQFFLGDYRPLIRDTLGNILDQETQLAPYRRNIQDPLCDPSMIPYPEPYQNMYQKRRLGALGIEWRPSSIKFGVGIDISLGQDYQMLPLADLDRMIEPLPEFIDAMYWEPENEVISDDNDSEYNVAEEYSSEGEKGSLSADSFSDPECSAEDSEVEHRHKDGIRRSRRKKQNAEVELMTSSGRRVKRRILVDHDGTLSGSKKTKKSRNGPKASKRKSSNATSSRPQRVAARNARNRFTQISGTSTDGEEGDGSEDDSSDSESMLKDLTIQSGEVDRQLQNLCHKYPGGEQPSLDEYEDIVRPPELPESQSNVGNRRRLVLKFSLRDSKKSMLAENTRPKCDNPSDLVYSSSGPPLGTNIENKTNFISEDPGSSNEDVIDAELSQNHSGRQPEKVEDHLQMSASDKGNEIRWGVGKVRTSKHWRSGDAMPTDAFTGSNASFNVNDENRNDIISHDKPENKYGKFSPSSEIQNHEGALSRKVCRDGEQSPDDVFKSSSFGKSRDCDPPKLKEVGTDISHELKEKSPVKISETPSYLETNLILGVPEEGEGTGRSSSLQKLHSDSDSKMYNAVHERAVSYRARTNADGFGGCMEEYTSNTRNDNYKSGFDFPEAAADAIGRTRSMGMKATLREPNVVNSNFKVREDHESMGTSKNAENSSMKSCDQLPSEEWISRSKMRVRSRSTRDRGVGYYDYDSSSLSRRKYSVRKLSWLMLSEHEEGYRYIPQLGDEVVYLRQGHQEYIETTSSSEIGPWISIKGGLGAVEICVVEGLDYATGSFWG
ncbi:hypothetical protein L1049_003756 [Liquidambar formosana]|uniref:Uncharacterized protein n=1 Tax=Liquidambar formosana TaxID=63359 RepID=A0AAP0RRM6_LIQFO